MRTPGTAEHARLTAPAAQQPSADALRREEDHGVALVPRHTSASRAPGRFHLATLENVRAGRHLEALLRPDRAARPAVRTVVDEIRAEASSIS